MVKPLYETLSKIKGKLISNVQNPRHDSCTFNFKHEQLIRARRKHGENKDLQ